MGTQSIINRDQEYYSELFEKRLFRYSDNYYAKKHFLVGEGADRDKIMFAMQMSPIFCTTNCTLIDYIKKETIGEINKKCKCNFICTCKLKKEIYELQ